MLFPFFLLLWTILKLYCPFSFRSNGSGVRCAVSIKRIVPNSYNSSLVHQRCHYKVLAHSKVWTVCKSSKFIVMTDQRSVFHRLTHGNFIWSFDILGFFPSKILGFIFSNSNRVVFNWVIRIICSVAINENKINLHFWPSFFLALINWIFLCTKHMTNCDQVCWKPSTNVPRALDLPKRKPISIKMKENSNEK